MKKHARRRQLVRKIYKPTEAEVRAFLDLKRAFAAPIFLIHYDHKKKIFVDLDASKEWSLSAMIYHDRENREKDFARTDVQPIMFLSKMLNQAERNYWPTELEIAGIVWVVRKIRHMIESSKIPLTIIYTDYSAAIPISKQTSLTSLSTDKLNLRLIRASQYLSQFNLELRHKSGKENTVPDALSRLTGLPSDEPERPTNGQAQISSMSFPHRIGHSNTPTTHNLRTAQESLQPTSQVADIGAPTHIDEARSNPHQGGFHRTYDRIVRSMYLQHLTPNLEKYIRHCPQCQLNQTKRHRPYGELMPIDRADMPFQTITMDFIVALPLTVKDQFDSLLTMICKFSK